MTIEAVDGVGVVAVGAVLKEPRLSIPRYQRPYSWRPATALQLLDDIHAAWREGDASYVLGAVILHREGSRLDVVDGQQRLLTLALLTALLDGEHDGTVQPGEASGSPVVAVRSVLARRLHGLAVDRPVLAAYVRENCWLVCVQTADADEAFRVFDSQNYRGRSLMPHDLLKAYHLREMVGTESEAMQAAVVERWESVPEAELDRLFSVYLYRVRRWAQGLPAPRFTVQDIGLFKGLQPHGSRSPHARYHLAAQAAVPMLAAWRESAAPEPETVREAQRTRFQLDAPVTAGRPFFEMVTFLHGELQALRAESYEPDWQDYASTDAGFQERQGRSRFRYVSELYLAAVLYSSNRFGQAEAAEVRQHLFRWAYALRVRRTRVLFRSVDNEARRPEGAFWLIRNATSPAELRGLMTPMSDEPLSERDPGLVDVLARLESA